MAPRKVTVFGGTGFLGQRVVQRLLERDFSVRVAVRHPERIAALFPALHLDAIQADVNDDRSVAAAVAGVEGVVNAVSLYAESGSQTFHSVHVEAATRVARLAREAGVGRFIHVSGIGADAGSASPYIRSRGKGEKAVREAFPATTLIRPSIMFGRGDAFLIPIARMLRRLPVFPLFGRGQTQLQPAYVEDVADAIARVMQNAQSLMCYELGGPRVYTYRSLLEVIARHLGKKPRLVPMPFGLWHALASVAEMLPEPPITRDVFGGVAFGGFEIAVHEFGPRQGKLHIERYRAGKFVIGEFGAHQLTSAGRLIVEAERRQNPYLAAKRGKAGIDRKLKACRLLTARITELQGPLQIFQCLAVLSHCDLHHGKHAVTH